jgi:hypothetical protein
MDGWRNRAGELSIAHFSPCCLLYVYVFLRSIYYLKVVGFVVLSSPSTRKGEE